MSLNLIAVAVFRRWPSVVRSCRYERVYGAMYYVSDGGIIDFLILSEARVLSPHLTRFLLHLGSSRALKNLSIQSRSLVVKSPGKKDMAILIFCLEIFILSDIVR